MGVQQNEMTIQNQLKTLDRYIKHCLTKSASTMSSSRYSFMPDFETGGGRGGFTTKKPLIFELLEMR
jgi:hypothetical protein